MYFLYRLAQMKEDDREIHLIHQNVCLHPCMVLSFVVVSQLSLILHFSIDLYSTKSATYECMIGQRKKFLAASKSDPSVQRFQTSATQNESGELSNFYSFPSWISFYSAIHLVDCGILDTNERIRAHVCSPLPSSPHFLVPLHRSPLLFLTYCTQGYHGVTIAAASPDEDYYKLFRKDKCQVFYMPTWDSAEVEQFLKVPGPLRDSVRPEEVCREGRGRAG